MIRVSPSEAEAMKAALKRALARLERAHGSRARAAAEMGVSRQLVQSWITEGRVSGHKVLLLEQFSGVSRYDLRPDLYRQERATSAA